MSTVRTSAETAKLATITPERIRQLRQRLGMTQEQFAAKIGVTFSTVNRWERGKAAPSPLAAGRLAELIQAGKTGDAEA